MTKKSSNYESVFRRLESEKKVSNLGKQFDATVAEMNNRMLEVRQDYRVKERNSHNSASNIILNS